MKDRGINDWQTKRLGDLLQLNYGKSLPVKNRVEGLIPVYGSNGVVGTHNKAIVDTPGVIVGRKGSAGQVHRSLGPFCPIDTTFYVTAEDAPETDLGFLFYLLRHIDLTRITGDVGVPGLNREMAYLEPVRFPTTLSEQKKIAHILSTVQRAIETQERIIQTTTELKKALMQKLFTEGIRNEPQKQTEIGPIPESWEAVTFGDYADFKNGINFTKAQKGYIGILTIDVLNMYGRDCTVSMENLYRVNKKLPSNYLLNRGDLLFVRSSLKLEGVGWTSLFNGHEEPATYCGFIIRARLHGSSYFCSRFLTHYFRTDSARKNLVSRGTKVAITNINQGILSLIKVPKPPNKDQSRIADYIDKVDAKIQWHMQRRSSLKDLFRTLLHELMTAKTRVTSIDLNIA